MILFVYYLHLFIVFIHLLFLLSKIFFTSTNYKIDNVYIISVGLIILSWIIFKECPLSLLEKKHIDPHYKNGTCKLFFPFLRYFFGTFELFAANIIKTIVYINLIILSKNNTMIQFVFTSVYILSFFVPNLNQNYCQNLRNQN
jgi:hypothetical protein